MKILKVLQQGDVLLKKISDVPRKLEPDDSRYKFGQMVLAEGEHTGHAHRIAVSDKATLGIDEEFQVLMLSVSEEVELTHNTHNAFSVPPGTYFVDFVRRIDPFTEEVSHVKD